MSLFDACECSVIDDSSVAEDVTVTNVQFDLHRFVADSDVSFHFVDLKVRDDEGNTVQVNSLFDSRTQLYVLRQELAENLQYDVVGEVKLRGFDGSISDGKLTVLSTSLANRQTVVLVKFVVCENVNYDVCFLWLIIVV